VGRISPRTNAVSTCCSRRRGSSRPRARSCPDQTLVRAERRLMCRNRSQTRTLHGIHRRRGLLGPCRVRTSHSNSMPCTALAGSLPDPGDAHLGSAAGGTMVPQSSCCSI
jgi:hypothetical protein